MGAWVGLFLVGGVGARCGGKGMDGLVIHDDNDCPFCLLGRVWFRVRGREYI